jgi:CDGSH-type Zn-finger protein
MAEKKIKVTADGPYIVSGGVPLRKEIAVLGPDGEPASWRAGGEYPAREGYALCRCGKSEREPLCDGTHTDVPFDAAETAARRPFAEAAETYTGPGLDLKDLPCLCSRSRFCLRAGDVWTLVERSDDPECRRIAVEEACDCPSGRLVAVDKATGAPIEPVFEPSISVTEDLKFKVSGPLWIKGGVPIESADGHLYETRNRVALCRCGASKNKPFCDGSHIEANFNDGDDALKED